MFLKHFGVFYNTDGGAGGSGDGGTGSGGTADGGTGGSGKDAAYLEAELKKVIKDRDAAKQRARELEGKVLSDEDRAKYDELKAAAEKAEEERLKKAGEYEALRKQEDERRQKLAEKHAQELKDRDEKFGTLSNRFRDTVITATFGSATDLFGGHDQAKTILDVPLAKAYLGQYVTVEDDATSAQGFRVVVKNARGEPILGRNGEPAPFAEAMLELIDSLPNKDRMLRGSGKAGSGSSGGGVGAEGKDLSRLTAADFANPKIRDAVKHSMATAGGLQIGPAFDAMNRAKR